MRHESLSDLVLMLNIWVIFLIVESVDTIETFDTTNNSHQSNPLFFHFILKKQKLFNNFK